MAKKNQSKNWKYAFWGSTALFCLMMLGGAFSYFTSPDAVAAFTHLGFPQYFRVELGVAKILGVIALLAPQVPARVKEWAYAGFGINMISAAIAHLSSGDPFTDAIAPIVAFGLLVTSYVAREKLA